MKKKQIRFFSVFLIITVFFLATPSASALDEVAVGASSVVLIQPDTGAVLYTKNENVRIYPASLTKIMTVLLAVEAVENETALLTDMVTASNNITYDLIADGSTQGIAPGEIMSLENLMYCALVASANEACNIIAEHLSGSISAFVERMNSRAAELGCTGTYFKNTHGLPDSGHYTTAWDMAIIAEAAVSHPLFMTICNTVQIEIPATNLHIPRLLKNTNALLGDNDIYKGYYYEHAHGVKTGYTSAAGYCLVSTAVAGDVSLLAVVMGAQATENVDGTVTYGSFTDTVTLYNWAFQNFSYQTIAGSTDVVAELPVTMGSGANTVSVRPSQSIKALLPNDYDMSQITYDLTIYSQRDRYELRAPLSAGDVLGEISVLKDGEVIGTAFLVAAHSVSLSKGYYIRSEIMKILAKPLVKIVIAVFVILFLAYLVLVIRYRILRRRHLRYKRSVKRATGDAPVPSPLLPVEESEEDEHDLAVDYFKQSEDLVQEEAPPADEPGGK